MKADFGRRTKIICTIGPATGSAGPIEALIKAGMNVARLNFSHGTHEGHAAFIRDIRQLAARLNSPIAILQDLPGPKVRTGKLSAGSVSLRAGDRFVLTTREVPGDQNAVQVNLLSLPQDVKPGHLVFLDDGAMQLRVQAATATDVVTEVVVGGVLGEHKGVSVPEASLSVPTLTENDLQHLAFGLEQGVDLMALSFVRSAAQVLQVREVLRQKGALVPLIAKIETLQAGRNIDEIIAAADGIMVARGDLGVETPVQRVPLVQKEIIRKCNRQGKPVITATQMLESMVSSPRPTRAEVADVANAIFDGTDAIMLSAETSIGKYPAEATAMMDQIARETEAALPYERLLLEKGADLVPVTDDAISYDACHAAQQLGAAAIVAHTDSGSTARRVSKYRPRVPILAITPRKSTCKQLALSWGVHPYQVTGVSSVEGLFAQAVKLAGETGVARSGDLIVITAGVPIGVPGSTNLLKVERVP